MELRTVEGAGLAVGDGRLWIAADDAAEMVHAALALAYDEHRKIVDDLRERHVKEMGEVRTAYQEKHRLWCEAEERSLKLGRAETVMREYEQTIGDQAREIAALKQSLAAASLPKRKPRSDKP